MYACPRFWTGDGLTGSYSESEGPLGHSGLISPGCRITGNVEASDANFGDYAVNRDLRYMLFCEPFSSRFQPPRMEYFDEANRHAID
jgi:hypothetical protein